MLDPLHAPYVTDPYPIFEQLREESPVVFDEDLGLWVVSRFDDIHAALVDVASFANALTLVPVFPVCDEAMALFAQAKIDPVTAGSDPPIHTRTRRAITSTFPYTPKRAAAYEGMVEQRVDELIDQMIEKGSADFVRDFAWELPVLVILHLLGVPESDFDRIKRWSDGQIAMVWGHASPEEQVRLAQGIVDFANYCHDLAAKSLDDPKDDFPGALVRYRDDDDAVLTASEIGSILFNFLIAGHETTSNQLANGLYRALSTDGLWQRLASEPELVPQAVEEMLRHDPAIHGWLRFTTRDVELGGVVIPAGQRVLLLLGSANHDECRFDHGEVFDVDRENARHHLTFGTGEHFCVGAALARLEIRVSMRRLLTRLPGLRLAEGFTPEYLPNVGFRAMRSMSVRWD